jgi:hypothetical protein
MPSQWHYSWCLSSSYLDFIILNRRGGKKRLLIRTGSKEFTINSKLLGFIIWTWEFWIASAIKYISGVRSNIHRQIDHYVICTNWDMDGSLTDLSVSIKYTVPYSEDKWKKEDYICVRDANLHEIITTKNANIS